MRAISTFGSREGHVKSGKQRRQELDARRTARLLPKKLCVRSRRKPCASSRPWVVWMSMQPIWRQTIATTAQTTSNGAIMSQGTLCVRIAARKRPGPPRNKNGGTKSPKAEDGRRLFVAATVAAENVIVKLALVACTQPVWLGSRNLNSRTHPCTLQFPVVLFYKVAWPVR